MSKGEKRLRITAVMQKNNHIYFGKNSQKQESYHPLLKLFQGTSSK